MRRSSAKGVVTSCPIDELEDCDRWQIVDPFDITTGPRLKDISSSDNQLSSSDDDDVVVEKKRKLETSCPRAQKKKKT